MKSLFDLAPLNLGCRNVEKAVEIFRDLLWCHARKFGIAVTKINITSRVTVSDGGVDAKIDEDIAGVPADLLISAGTSYQLKTGTSFKPWQESQIRNELFGSSTANVNIDNLGSEVTRCLEQGNRYVIVCFGVDPTHQETHSAKETIINYFKQCGFVSPQVEVWGQTHLIGLITEFPSLVLKILGKSEYHFQTLSDWAHNADMTPPLQLGEAQEKWLSDIREALRTTKDHLRVIGEPGVGKSRLVLEALSTDDLASSVIYIPNAEDFQQSQLFNELIRSDLEYHVILVVDECPDKERASIWNVLKAYRSKCQLITIDHGPERSVDEAIRIMPCPPLDKEQITAILNQYIEVQDEARRWATWCEGSPRVAHSVGQNLKQNPDDIFRPPATVPIWERFVAGYDDADSEINRQRLIILRHVSLFQRFGFESPVSDEARFISDITSKVDPAITWGKFQSIVEHFKERRILQGRTTLFLVPKALHIYLWLDYWKHHGRYFNFKEFIESLPQGLQGWFTRMFIYAHKDLRAQQVVKDILSPRGLYEDSDFLISDIGTRFLSILAEADGEATLKCIERTFGFWSKERLHSWDTGRQHIVSALEKIAVWPDTFQSATRMLLRMGVTETSNYSNNASGTFAGLFSLIPSFATTEAPPSLRIAVLEEALKSEDIAERKLGLKACETALSTHSGFRIIGPEHQGLRPPAKLWRPKTYGELFDSYRAVWNLLFKVSRSWPNNERASANDILIDTARGLVRYELIANDILATIEVLIDDLATRMPSMISFIVNLQRHHEVIKTETLERIKQLDIKIAGSSLEKQIDRYVINSSWDEEREAGIPEEQSLERRITGLAERALNERVDFLPLLEKLTLTDGFKLYQFAFEIGKRDPNRELLQPLLDAQKKAGASGKTQFFGGYLYAIKEASENEWEALISSCLGNKDFQRITGQLIWRTGVNDNLLEKMLQAHKTGILHAHDFTSLLYYTKHINQKLIERTLSSLLDSADEKALFVALEIANSFYCDRDVIRELPKTLIFKLLTMSVFFTDRLDTMQSYYWGVLTNKYLDLYPEYGIEFFDIIMTNLENYSFMSLKSHSPFHSIAERIAKAKPAATWEIIRNLLSDLSTDLAHGVLRWLTVEKYFGDSGIQPLTYFPSEWILAWIDESPDSRAPEIAYATPKTLSKEGGGQLTRELLHRYGSMERVKSALSANFFTGGWSGPASEHYRKMRDQARAWLDGETSQPVIQWLNDYIDNLNSQIKNGEIREEREI